MATCGDCGSTHERPRAVRCHACSYKRQRNQVDEWHRKLKERERAADPIFCIDCNASLHDRIRSAKRCRSCCVIDANIRRRQSYERQQARKKEAAERVQAEVKRLRSLSMPSRRAAR